MTSVQIHNTFPLTSQTGAICPHVGMCIGSNMQTDNIMFQSYPKWVHLKSIHYNDRRLLKNHTTI